MAVRLVAYDDLPTSAASGRLLVHTAAFGGAFSARSIRAWRTRSEGMSPYAAIFALDGREVVGQAFAFRFPYDFPSGRETVTGIAAVATRLDRSRAGVAESILREIHRRERAEGLRHTLLWTNRSWRAHHLYERLGYRDLYAPTYLVHDRPRAGAPGRGIRVAPGRAADVDAIEALHAEHGAGRLGFASRPRGLLAALVAGGDIVPKEEFLVARRGRAVVGYAFAEHSKFRTICGELVGRDAPATAALVRSVERRAAPGGVVFRDGTADALRRRLRPRGYASASAGWFSLMGARLDGTVPADPRAEFGADDPRFLCLAGDRF